MKVHRLPDKIAALVFDMDLTLYTSPEYGKVQIVNLISIAGKHRGLSPEEAVRDTEAARIAWAAAHNGKKPSLSNLILSWGFTMEDNVRWRESAYEPEKYLKKDAKLHETLLALSACSLGIITNNPVSIAKRTLVCLGIEDCFDAIIGLDTLMIAKPHELPFIKIIELLKNGEKSTGKNISAESTVSVGDRYEIDLEIPLQMGMGAVQVDGVEDVYNLPDLLAGRICGKE